MSALFLLFFGDSRVVVLDVPKPISERPVVMRERPPEFYSLWNRGAKIEIGPPVGKNRGHDPKDETSTQWTAVVEDTLAWFRPYIQPVLSLGSKSSWMHTINRAIIWSDVQNKCHQGDCFYILWSFGLQILLVLLSLITRVIQPYHSCTTSRVIEPVIDIPIWFCYSIS